MAYKKVIEMLGENLASFLELTKKWLVDWSVDTKKLLHFFHNIKKEDLTGLLDGTHQVVKKVVCETLEIFLKTNVIEITKNPESFVVNQHSVLEFLDPIIKREKELKNPDPYIDNDIWNYFNGKITPGFAEDFVSTIYRFLVNLTHKQILDEAKNIGIKKVYTYLEGLSIIRQAILSGEVYKKGTGVIVYFKIEENDTFYRFNAFRRDDGELRVNVSNVFPDNEWYAGVGACFSN